MSYRRPDTGDSLRDYFISLTDFLVILPNMLNAKTDDEFIQWFEKLVLIDKRALLLYLRKYKSDISPERLMYAQSRFIEEI